MNEKETNEGNFWLEFIIGSIVGALTVFFLGTKEGKKYIENLIDKIQNSENSSEQNSPKLEPKSKNETVNLQIENVVEKPIKKLPDKITSTFGHLVNIQKKGLTILNADKKNVFKKNGKKLSK